MKLMVKSDNDTLKGLALSLLEDLCEDNLATAALWANQIYLALKERLKKEGIDISKDWRESIKDVEAYERR